MYQLNRLSAKYRVLAILLVLVVVFACITPFVFHRGVVIAAKGYLSVSVLAPPGTIYDWIGGVPTQTDNTNYDWSGGLPHISLEVIACSPNIDNDPDSWSVNSGSPISPNSNYATGLDFFTVTNNSGGSVDITISGTDMTGGGYTWDLADDGSPSDMTYALKAGLDGGDYTIIVRETATYNTLVSELGNGLTQDWGLKLWTPTTFTNENNAKSGTVTITATCS